jgi:UDPglucose--hexose-1-phosphate uridylyltransferase
MSELLCRPHRRFNPLLREWVLVSPQRTDRPWQGKVEGVAAPAQVTYDPHCYLCPGNERAGGKRNPTYAGTFVFDNDFPALLPPIEGAQTAPSQPGELLVAQPEAGICRVVCFSPRHDLTVPRMTQPEIRAVVNVWTDQFELLGRLPWIQHVQIFENRGALMGASNPHPHCQIWANAHVPNIPAREVAAFEAYRSAKSACLLCDYFKIELASRERIVCENDSFIVLVPYWAVWPFEAMLLAKRHMGALPDLSEAERDDLAETLRRAGIRYDNLFETSFPYSLGFHQRPTDGQPHPEWHFHAHYLPPLLRSATIQKFMVGYELLAAPQRDITPEAAAQRLRDAGDVHYLDRR